MQGDKSFKYIQHRHKGFETRSLHNLKSDPYETINLVQDDAYAETLDELRRGLEESAKDSGELEQRLGQNYWQQVCE